MHLVICSITQLREVRRTNSQTKSVNFSTHSYWQIAQIGLRKKFQKMNGELPSQPNFANGMSQTEKQSISELKAYFHFSFMRYWLMLFLRRWCLLFLCGKLGFGGLKIACCLQMCVIYRMTRYSCMRRCSKKLIWTILARMRLRLRLSWSLVLVHFSFTNTTELKKQSKTQKS